MLDPKEIREKLARLRKRDPQHQLFGAGFHHYELNPCLDEAAVQVVENRYVIQLPEDYRRFLLEVGNGGAGPYYGLFSLGEQDGGWGSCRWEEGYLLGDPAAPFPYREKWNLSEEVWARMPDHAKMPDADYDRVFEEWDSELEQTYWDGSVMNGAIPICHLGCALRQWLVITGPERGTVWGDDRADYNGIYPLQGKKGERVTFAKWYMEWLDAYLHQVIEAKGH